MTNDDRTEIANHVAELLKPAIQEQIKTTVNGKIDRLDQKLDNHINEIRPVIDFINGSKVTGKLVGWIAGIILAITGSIAAITGLIK